LTRMSRLVVPSPQQPRTPDTPRRALDTQDDDIARTAFLSCVGFSAKELRVQRAVLDERHRPEPPSGQPSSVNRRPSSSSSPQKTPTALAGAGCHRGEVACSLAEPDPDGPQSKRCEHILRRATQRRDRGDDSGHPDRRRGPCLIGPRSARGRSKPHGSTQGSRSRGVAPCRPSRAAASHPGQSRRSNQTRCRSVPARLRRSPCPVQPILLMGAAVHSASNGRDGDASPPS
jgi:hypothetical protein